MAVPHAKPESASTRDPKHDKERWRLAWRYADMTDGELQSLAAESASLTEVARRALQSELYRRGFPIELQEPDAAERATPASAAGQASPARFRSLVTVRRFRDMPEALLAKSVLESAGIECLLGDANIIRTDWLWSNLVGGVKLRVQEEDLAEAARLLDQDSLDQTPPERFAVQGAGDFEQPRCPRCQSIDVSFENLPKPISVPGIFAAPPAPRDPEWTCHACGKQWHDLEPTG